MTETEQGDREKLAELLQDMPIAMLTTFTNGRPRSVPMARQEVEASDELWFITARSSGLVDAIRSEPMVALTFSSRDSWVSLVGRAAIVDDREKLADLWNTFAEAWLPGGPDDPEAALLRVDIDSAEYWDTPGGKIASLLSFAKTKLTGDTYDAEHGKLRP